MSHSDTPLTDRPPTSPDTKLDIDRPGLIDLSVVLPDDLRRKYEAAPGDKLPNPTDTVKMAKHSREHDLHPLTVLVLVQWLLAEATTVGVTTHRYYSIEEIRERHGQLHAPNTYRSQAQLLCECGLLDFRQQGNAIKYTIDAKTLAPAFQPIDDDGTTKRVPPIDTKHKTASTSPFHGIIPFPVPFMPDRSPRSWRTFFEDRYRAGHLLLSSGVLMTLWLAQWFQLTGFDPHSSALWAVGAMIAVGVSAMIVGTVEIGKQAYDLQRLGLRLEVGETAPER